MINLRLVIEFILFYFTLQFNYFFMILLVEVDILLQLFYLRLMYLVGIQNLIICQQELLIIILQLSHLVL